MSKDARLDRLTKLLQTTLRGRTPISPNQKDLFLEAIYSRQADRVACISEIIGSNGGLMSLQAAMRYDLSTKFLNGHATSLLMYLQAPEVETTDSGRYLEKILLTMADPPVFWSSLCSAFKNKALQPDGERCFAWLLLHLITLPDDKANFFREFAQDDEYLQPLLCSQTLETRSLAQKIKNIIDTRVDITSTDAASEGATPGGRHDNDFADFRQIAIMPTADEILSEEKPFLRTSFFLQDPETEDSRIGMYLDNQFRLLREEMLNDMREELQVATGKKKGRYRGHRIQGLDVLDAYFGPEKKPCKWAIRFKLHDDLPFFKNVNPQDRKKCLQDSSHRRFFAHQSLVCLSVDNEVVAFPTVYRDRDDDQLAHEPPILLLQFDGELSSTKALSKFKSGGKISVISVDTAIFAFEPFLKAMQAANGLPFSEELLFWKETSVVLPPARPTGASALVSALQFNPHADLQPHLHLSKPIKLDSSQAESFLAGLTQRVSLIQGPPGTGKSFIGALLGKAIHQFSDERILVVCFTNHALDQFLEDLIDIGIPESDMVRLGFKGSARTTPLLLRGQTSGYRRGRADWTMVDSLKSEAQVLLNELDTAFNQYISGTVSLKVILEYLEFEHPTFFEAFSVPESEDGMVRVTKKGAAVDELYLLNQWRNGWNAGIFSRDSTLNQPPAVWNMPPGERHSLIAKWKEQILKEDLSRLYSLARQYNECLQQLDRAFLEKDIDILRHKRIIGCTTTGAAKYTETIQAASPSVLLVEEAGEILESHVLTALGKDKNQLILIGDHQQLRPKVNNYPLTVEKGDGYDLNMSLFERLVLKLDYPHGTLSAQHRMRPEISALIRHLTYPDLVDAERTKNRPDLKGVRDNIVFINHDHPEDELESLQFIDNPNTATSSKQNTHEAQMILKIVRYLGQQGYGTDHLVILTPYLGQLQNLRLVLKNDTDPVLNDLDSHDLLRAGLVSPATAQLNKKPIRLATIDNYQGEESDIVIVSLTRSNPNNDIGFMFAPQRLNVLLSRARNALIMIGNATTFTNAKKGKEIWNKLFGLLKDGGHMYDGLPVKCERHQNRTTILKQPLDFEIECPDGGCTEPCGVDLNCKVHKCPSKCHQLSDHSKMLCKEPVYSKCAKGHDNSYLCHKGLPPICGVCAREQKLADKLQREAFSLKQKRDQEQQEYDREMVKLDDEIKTERQRIRDAQIAQERNDALLQKKKDLSETRTLADVATSKAAQGSLLSTVKSFFMTGDSTSSTTDPSAATTTGAPAPSPASGSQPQISPSQSSQSPQPNTKGNTNYTTSSLPDDWKLKVSEAREDWERQKRIEGASNDAIDAIMEMTGLESVKEQVLRIKDKIDASKRQHASLKNERFNAVLLGNPGTGKTTIARQYAKFLTSVGVLPGNEFVETTGSRLANNGVSGIEKQINEVINNGGGAIFVDEAYQLTGDHNFSGGQVLDYMLAEMENHTDKLVFILAGYSKQMEKFFEHNPGLKSRVPYELKFEDYKDPQLLDMLVNLINKTYKLKSMQVEGGLHGLWSRIAVRRLGRGRGRDGFGNARALQNMFAKVRERQAERLKKERKQGMRPNDLMLLGEDLIGPDPSKVMGESEAWKKLQSMIGLSTVKSSVKELFILLESNYLRELKEKEIMQMSLNRVFLGPPGTGKTTVAQLYGRILKDLGMLSNGEVVVKNPSDFIGDVLGASESKTRGILAATAGKVLVIDEAYMLYSGKGGTGNHSDSFKTAVIDTIVAEVQSGMSDDRCVLMLGYEEEIMGMFQNVNPGLSRRFDIERAFRFENFNDSELLQIMELKMKQQDLTATDEAKKVAVELLSRARTRPNFGNGGEVDNLLGRAKARSQARLGSTPDVCLEPQDFDPDHDRGERAATNLAKLFEDVVGCEDIITKLGEYQNIARTMKSRGMDPRNKIPMNFIFKGPPGTGKTTTARKMGQVFFDMGFLSAVNVVECSASDMVGQYVGHTGPKTKELFEKALGQVLFIDEAYRLAEGHFAQEAMDEMVATLTNEKFMGKMVVILAGYDHDMNRLMNVNTGLSSRFPETIYFANMSPEHCLKMLDKELAKDKISLPALHDPSSSAHVRMTRLIDDLALLPSWGNGRDIKTLATQMGHKVYVKAGATTSTTAADEKMTLSEGDAIACMAAMLKERSDRENNVSVRRQRNPSQLPQADMSNTTQPPRIATGTATRSTPPPARTGTQRQQRLPQDTRKNPDPRKKQDPRNEQRKPEIRKFSKNGGLSQEARDPGVSNAIWHQLQEAKRRLEEEQKRAREADLEMERELKEARREEEEAAEAAKVRALEIQQAREEAKKQELMKQREAALLKEAQLKAERERLARELNQKRQQEQRRQQEEAKAQQKLRELGICPAGFIWIPIGDGYRCAGGSHFVHRFQLGM